MYELPEDGQELRSKHVGATIDQKHCARSWYEILYKEKHFLRQRLNPVKHTLELVFNIKRVAFFSS